LKQIFSIIITAVLLFSCTERRQAHLSRSRIEEVGTATHRVASIDPNDSSKTDLAFLKGFIGNARIVLLGEQSHGDGATFLAKGRLVRYLHEEMGFDVIAFEGGMFESELAGESILQGMPVGKALRNSIFDVWTGSKQFLPVMEYIQHSLSTASPMRVTGFDMQASGRWGRDSLLPALKSVIRKSIPSDTATLKIIAGTLDTWAKSMKQFKAIDSSSREQFYSAVERARKSLDGSSSNNPEAAYWAQQLKSVGTLTRFTWKVDFEKPDMNVINLRDEQMADNMLWLARNKYNKKKIIVWGASSHLSKNRQFIVRRNNIDSAMIPMGHHLWKAMGDSLRFIGFTAYTGRVGARARRPWDLAKADSGTVEDALNTLGFEFSFLDFRKVPVGHWLRGEVRARPFGYTTMKASWSEMIDGLFFTRTMIPSDQAKEEE
jgi:erythromycin esterase